MHNVCADIAVGRGEWTANALLFNPAEFTIAVFRAGEVGGRCRPADGVFDDFQDVLVVIGREGLVARAEVDDPAGPAGPGAARSKNLAAAEAADEEGALRLGD